MEQFEQIILTALQTKYPGVDAKILGRIAKKTAKTANSEDEAKTIADGITLQQIIDSHADYRATEATQNAVRNYETKHGIKDGKPVAPANQTPPEGGAQTPPAEEIPAWAKQLIADNKAQRDEIAALRAERTTTSRLEQFRAAIASAPDKIRARYEKDFSRLTFKDDEDFNAYLEEIKPDITAIAEDAGRRQPFVSRPLGGGASTGTATEAEADAVVAKLSL